MKAIMKALVANLKAAGFLYIESLTVPA